MVYRKNNEKQIKSIKYKNECAWNERNCALLCTEKFILSRLGLYLKQRAQTKPAFSTFEKLKSRILLYSIHKFNKQFVYGGYESWLDGGPELGK